MSKSIQSQIQKLINISCHLVSLNFMYFLDIHVPNAVNPRMKYIPRKYKSNVLTIRIINPADHHTILSLIMVNAVVNNISVNGII